MATTSTAKTLFGAPGASDPVMFHPGLVCIKRKFDFSVTPLDVSEVGANQEVFGIPKSFVAIGAFFESGKDKDGKYPAAEAMTLKVADLTATANDVTIGTAFTPSNSAYKRQTLLNKAAAGSDDITQATSSTYAVSAISIPNTAVAFDAVDSTTGERKAYLALGSADRTQGSVAVGIIGFVPDGDSLGNVVTAPYRVVTQPQTNVAGTDPWQEKSVRG